MRKLKFRAYIRHLDVAYEVDKINFDNKMVEFNMETYLSGKNTYGFSFDEVELMQFIGLKDKYGLEIFEGDIVKTDMKIDGNDTFEVKYEESIGMFVGKPCEESGKALTFDMMKARIIPKDIQVEIIGDIYS